MLLDFILPKETKNLIKINKLHEKFNDLSSGKLLCDIEEELELIKTKEHKKKIELILKFIEIYEKNNPLKH